MNRIALVVFALLFALPRTAVAQAALERLDNWHHWRGPLATGEAPRGDPPLDWDEHKNVKWKAAIPGRGSATPIVWKDQVFVVTAVDTGRPAPAAPDRRSPLLHPGE